MEDSSCQNEPEDPMEEVKKLQELVKQLEHQNQQLRNRQNVSDNDEKEVPKANRNDNMPRTPLRPLDSRLNPNVESEDNRDPRCAAGAEKQRRSGVLDDVDLINIDDLDISDEDSWLYTSPKGLSFEDRAVSPYKWLRKDVEDPHNKELQLARRALAYKLDESAILSACRSSDCGTFKKSPQGKPPIGRVIDSRTFTRGKKKRTPFEEGCDPLPVIESLRDEDEDEEEEYSAPRGSAPRGSTEVIDVQEIARMQEESLRQSSPSTPKKITMSSIPGRRWSNSSKNSTSDPEDVFTVDGVCSMPKQSGLIVTGDLSNSAHSSPPESLHGSNSSLENGTDSFRHSLPNLSKGYIGGRTFQRQHLGNAFVEVNGAPPRGNGMPAKLSSIARTTGIQGEHRLGSRSASNLRSPSTAHRVQRPVANGSPFLSPPALSPTTSRHLSPTPKGSSLPRLSRIPPPRARSGIPVSRGAGESEENELWSDGCY